MTKNGYGDMVIMSIEVYEKDFENSRILSALSVAEKDVQYGKVRNAFDALKETRDKYGI